MVTPDHTERVRAAATAFREAILSSPREDLPICVRDFPAGACGDASLMLGSYLKHLGLGAWEYVAGVARSARDRYSHAWIRQGDLIVDITAEQFPECPPGVLVTTDPGWHSQFEIDVQHDADVNV